MIRKVYDKELIMDMILQNKQKTANINEGFVEKEYRRITRSLSEYDNLARRDHEIYGN